MRSRATGDFSRFLSEPGRRYTAVWMQQGRVQLDSDWNEQAALAGRARELAVTDVIGASGAPFEHAGFAISLLGELSFDGRDDYVYVPSPPAPRARTVPTAGTTGTPGAASGVEDEGAGFTWEAWIRPAAGGGAILGRFAQAAQGQTAGAAAASDVAILFLDAEGKLAFRRSGVQAIEIAADRPLATNRTQHVAVTSATRSTSIWVDGRLAAQLPVGRALADLPAVFLIGAALEGRRPHMPFAGRIHDVRWWHRPLSARELAAAAARVALPPTDLAAWWPLDVSDADGDAVTDRSASGAHGVLGAGASRPEWTVQDLGIGPGRFYVHGVPCENFEPTRFTAQPEAPGLVLPEGGVHLAYLDLWERFITAIQDPEIAEVALGGPTTTARSRTVAQVRLLPVDGERGAKETWDTFLAAARSPRGTLAARRTLPPPTMLGNLLYRIEIHDGGLPIEPNATGDRPVATFKWSRQNGSQTFSIVSVAGAQVTVSAPESGRLTIPPGAIVEWLDDAIELSGEPGKLHQTHRGARRQARPLGGCGPLREQCFEIERLGEHLQILPVPRPLFARPVAVDLDPVALEVG